MIPVSIAVSALLPVLIAIAALLITVGSKVIHSLCLAAGMVPIDAVPAAAPM